MARFGKARILHEKREILSGNSQLKTAPIVIHRSPDWLLAVIVEATTACGGVERTDFISAAGRGGKTNSGSLGQFARHLFANLMPITGVRHKIGWKKQRFAVFRPSKNGSLSLTDNSCRPQITDHRRLVRDSTSPSPWRGS
jgi:hypothetical protein